MERQFQQLIFSNKQLPFIHVLLKQKDSFSYNIHELKAVKCLLQDNYSHSPLFINSLLPFSIPTLRFAA
jgi:hypothetical protein